MVRCKKCTVPDCYPEAHFSDGVCSYCTRQEAKSTKGKREVLGREKLEQLLATRKGPKYDCAVAISGGKDSSYVLYYLRRVLGVRACAIFFDNGFIIDLALENVRSICEKLDVDLFVGRASPYRRKIIRETLMLAAYANRKPSVCRNCENNLRSYVINESLRNKVPFIFWGQTDFEDSHESFVDPKVGTFREQSEKKEAFSLSQKISALAGSSSIGSMAKAMLSYIRLQYYIVRDNIATRAPLGFPRLFNPRSLVSCFREDIGTVHFFDYIEYNPFKMVETLKREVGWCAPEKRELRMDCRIHSLDNYDELKRNGLTKDGFTLGVHVRNGMLTREEALEREEALISSVGEESRALYKELGVSSLYPD